MKEISTEWFAWFIYIVLLIVVLALATGKTDILMDGVFRNLISYG